MSIEKEPPSLGPQYMKVALSLPPQTLLCSTITEELSVDPQHGLSAIDAQVRLATYGPNLLSSSHGTQLFKIIIHQISNAMILVLIFAMAVNLGIKSWIEGSVIAAVVLLNIFVGFF